MLLGSYADQSLHKENIINPQLNLAWCSHQTNLITIYDLQAQKVSNSFYGAQLAEEASDTYLLKVPDSDHLFSFHHSRGKAAKFEIYDTSLNKIVFAHEEIQGDVSFGGDFAIANQKKLAVLISVNPSTSYHVLNLDSFQIIKRVPWKECHRKPLSSLHLSPDDEIIAMMDEKGVCSFWQLSDQTALFTIKASADFQCFGGPRGIANRCRWNPIISNSVVAISFDGNFLNLVDPVKQTFLLKSPIILDDWSHWLEWAEDGSLLACTSSSSIKIYDNREKKVVKTLYKHIRDVRSLQWSPDGRFIASGSDDNTVKVTEFSTEKAISSTQTLDKRTAWSVAFI